MKTGMIEIEQKLTPLEISVVKEFLSSLTAFPQVESIFLYGSRGEMNSTEWSDVDIAVVVTGKEHIREIEKEIESWLIDFSPDILFHPVVIDRDILQHKGIGESIKKGILLWERE